MSNIENTNGVLNGYKIGIRTGLQLAINQESVLARSMATFVSVREWEAYKKGVQDYKKVIEKLLEEHMRDE